MYTQESGTAKPVMYTWCCLLDVDQSLRSNPYTYCENGWICFRSHDHLQYSFPLPIQTHIHKICQYMLAHTCMTHPPTHTHTHTHTPTPTPTPTHTHTTHTHTHTHTHTPHTHTHTHTHTHPYPHPHPPTHTHTHTHTHTTHTHTHTHTHTPTHTHRVKEALSLSHPLPNQEKC